MKISYYPETDSRYIDLAASPSNESREISPGVVIDFAAAGNVTGIDIDKASHKLDLSELILSRLPVTSQRMTA